MYYSTFLRLSRTTALLTKDARNRLQLYENIINGGDKDDKTAKLMMQNDHKDAETGDEKETSISTISMDYLTVFRLTTTTFTKDTE